jgi:hypothetical protein
VGWQQRQAGANLIKRFLPFSPRKRPLKLTWKNFSQCL